MEIKYSELMAELKKFGFYWFIEDRSGTPYFRIYHRTQIGLNNNNPSLWDYLGKDYAANNKTFEYEEAEYYKYANRQLAGNIEFIGYDMNNRRLQMGEIKEITSDNYFYDIQHIFDNAATIYDDASNTAWILVCCYINTDYYVRPSTGILNQQETNNGELSHTYNVEYLLVEIPFDLADGNDTIITFATNRQRKRKQVTLNIPIRSIDDFESESYINTYEGSAEMDSLIHDFNKNVAQLKYRVL